MFLTSIAPKLHTVYFVIIFFLLLTYFGLHITYKITLKNLVLKTEAEQLFRENSIKVDLRYYPVGYSLDVPIRTPKSISNDVLLHGLSDRLNQLDRIAHGDKFIVSGSSNRGGGIFSISGNDRGTPEMLIALVEQIPQLDATSIRIKYPQKVFYATRPFLSGIFTSNRIRHDPRVQSIETGIISPPIIYIFWGFDRLSQHVGQQTGVPIPLETEK